MLGVTPAALVAAGVSRCSVGVGIPDRAAADNERLVRDADPQNRERLVAVKCCVVEDSAEAEPDVRAAFRVVGKQLNDLEDCRPSSVTAGREKHPWPVALLDTGQTEFDRTTSLLEVAGHEAAESRGSFKARATLQDPEGGREELLKSVSSVSRALCSIAEFTDRGHVHCLHCTQQ